LFVFLLAKFLHTLDRMIKVLKFYSVNLAWSK